MSSIKSQFKDHYILFIESAFIAVHQMDEPSALALIEAASLLNPEASLTHITRSYFHLCKLELKKAIEILNEVLKKDSENELAKAFLAMAQILSAEHAKKGYELLETLKKSQDSGIKEFSDNAIAFMTQLAKK